jgi:hypothetical protein
VVRESEVIIGAEVDDLALPRAYRASLRPREHPLALVKALFLESCEIGAQALD